VYDVDVQPDGKIVMVGGYASVDLGTCVSRLNPDGTPDAAFNANTLTGWSISQPPRSVTALPNGKILVTGSFNKNGGAVLLNADGTEDASFVFSADVKPSISYSYPRVAVQADGKFLIAATTNNSYKIERFNTDNTKDNTFLAANNAAVSGVYISGMAVQQDGKIVVSGYFLSDYNGTPVSGVMRLLPDGQLDTGFDTENGFGNTSLVYHCALQADGKILLTTQDDEYKGEDLRISNPAFTTNQVVIRLNGDATPTATTSIPAPADVRVFPNPASQYVTLDIETSSWDGTPVLCRLTDITGKTVFTTQLTQPQTTLALPNLPTGTYLITMPSNDQLIHRKLVIH